MPRDKHGRAVQPEKREAPVTPEQPKMPEAVVPEKKATEPHYGRRRH